MPAPDQVLRTGVAASSNYIQYKKTALFHPDRAVFYAPVPDAKKKPPPEKAAVLLISACESARRTCPDERKSRRHTALRVVRWRIAFFGGIPRNVNAVIAVENVEHSCTSKRKLLLPLKCATCLKFDQENSPWRVAFSAVGRVNLHGSHAKIACLA